MIEIESLGTLQAEIRACMDAEKRTLDELRTDIRKLRASTRRIHPHSTTAISLVGTDGGHNKIEYDPFLLQVIRVVDSSNNEYCLEAVTPRTAIDLIHERHLKASRPSRTPFGRMMEVLKVSSLYELSIISRSESQPKPSWIQVYRELMEWAVLLDIVRSKDFASDTLIICDGLLRSKVFAGALFKNYREALEEAIAWQYAKNRRRVYVAGIAKESQVLQTYHLAMALEGVLRTSYPAFVDVPREIEDKVYTWSEYARGSEQAAAGGEANKYVAGKMFLVKFGSSPNDPIWATDLLESQADEAATVLGYMLNDALDGFPIPFYPHCLQRAHANAALVGLDMDILQDAVVDALRQQLGSEKWMIDEARLQAADIAGRRYE